MRRFTFVGRPTSRLGLLSRHSPRRIPGVLSPSSGSALATPSVPHYDHVFLVMEENNGFSDVIGNPAAPNLNYLAEHFGIATEYHGPAPPQERPISMPGRRVQPPLRPGPNGAGGPRGDSPSCVLPLV